MRRIEKIIESALFEDALSELPLQYQYLDIINKRDERIIIKDSTFSSAALQNDSVPMLGFTKPISRLV